ncbi:MAG: hypothetical protein HY050_00655 [Actinobacteria bacterium]|nr:hypothetical protein [Actinomycetota bacterium]
MGLWIIPADNGPGPYSFTTEPLSVQRFPAGTYYLQVDTKNGDPFASTRQEEFSEIIVVELKAGQSSSNQKVPLLSSLKLPLSNGTPICTAWRDHLSLGNRVVQAANTYNRRMNTALEKIPTRTPAMELIYQRALRQTSEIKKALAEDLIRAKSACSDTPSVVAENGEFVPVPIPSSNGTPACNASRKRLVYVNQELTKIVNNIKTTKRTQTTRINQLETRFKQLSTDLNKSWAELFQTCNPF